MALEFLLDDKEKDLIPPLEQVPMEPTPPLDTREEIFAAANTAEFMSVLGDEEASELTEEDEGRARDLFESAREPSKYEKQLPGVMRKLNALLDEYDHTIIGDAQQVRNYVTNRLIEESSDDDPKIRMRALELLGKISDVGLFAERQEVTVKHQSTEELEDLLRNKLTRLIDGDISDATIIEPADSENNPAQIASSVTPDEIFDE
jgi:hypothetical protein